MILRKHPVVCALLALGLLIPLVGCPPQPPGGNDNTGDNTNDNVVDNVNDNVDDNVNDNVVDNENDNVDDNVNDNVVDNENDNTGGNGGDVASGQALYSTNCTGCHGADASGVVGPNIQGFTEAQVATGLESANHAAFNFSAQDIADIAAYLGTL